MDEQTRTAAVNFAADAYATETTGVTLERVDENYALCSLEIAPKHLNANHQVMGGAIYTLADFAFAVASNGAQLQSPTVTLSSQIQFLGTPKGARLIAETNCLKSGRGTCVLEVNITDELNNAVAKVVSTGYRTKR